MLYLSFGPQGMGTISTGIKVTECANGIEFRNNAEKLKERVCA